ncbi:DEAD/DEAH box helicase [Bifidobacterium moukalabense]|uniref:DEAD/DEAH box helicase n=1 Tax=Bifidobacterium moukalabense TaxID=1333651 RepID=UPI0010F7171C|nr:DEAD/DEAH box helicase [Bifidobacterium moukalabense]
MPDTVFEEDALADNVSEYGEEEERPLTFAELGVPGPLVRVLAADDKKTAFPIQADTLPDSLAGRDVLGRGRTGSGKTLAFSIPMVARLGEVDAGEYENMSQFRHEVKRVQQGHAEERRSEDFVPSPRGLVLAPTRELANQINDVLMPLAQIYGMSTTTIYGGVRYARQIRDLKAGADIVVACPGRLEDMIQQHALTLENVQVAVIDEADEMADMGFLPPVKRLLAQVSFDAQIMLFSATLDHGVDEVVDTFLTDPKVHSVDSATAAVDEMTHHVFETTQAERAELVRTLASGSGRRILFTRTKFQTQKLAKDLTKRGIPAAELHGNLSQNQRDRNLAAFESGDVNVMVATDVAARGIDVSGVELVVQVEPPEDSKSFLHRSGRTARAGKSGDVVTIVLPNQRRRVRRLLHEAGLKIKPIEVTHDSPEVLELVGEVAEPVFGWTLEQSQPAGNPRRRRNGRGGTERGDRFGHANRSGGRNKDRGKDKGGKPFKSERGGRNERSERYSDNHEEHFEPKRNRAERRAEKFKGRSNREAIAREERWENPDGQRTRRDEHEGKRNNKRREKYARLHEQQRAESDESQDPGRRGFSGKKAKQSRKQFDGNQGASSRKQRKADARERRRFEDDRQGGRNERGNRGGRYDGQQGGRRIHRKEIRVIQDERSADAKRHDRRMEAKHGERHDKHAGKPFRKHSKIRKAPFRMR